MSYIYLHTTCLIIQYIYIYIFICILSYLAKYVGAVICQAQLCPQLLIVLAEPVQLHVGLQHFAFLVLDEIALCCDNVYKNYYFLFSLTAPVQAVKATKCRHTESTISSGQMSASYGDIMIGCREMRRKVYKIKSESTNNTPDV